MFSQFARYYNKYRRAVSYPSFGMYKSALTNVLALIIFCAMGVFYLSAFIYNALTDLPNEKQPLPHYAIVFLINAFVILAPRHNRIWREAREHLVIASLVFVIIATHLDIADVYQETMYMMVLMFLVGFVTRPIFTFFYGIIMNILFVHFTSFQNYNGFYLIIISLTFVSVSLISFLLSKTLEVLFEEHKRNIYQLQMLYENDKQLFSNLAHRLKTPLTVLQAEAKLTENNKSSSRINHVINDIRMSIDELTELSKMNLSQTPARRRKVNLVQTLDYICKDSEILARNYAELHKLKRTIKFTTNLKSAFLYTAEEQVRESILNLIDNSIRHNVAKPIVTIEVKLTKRFGDYVISVIDDGVGISEEKLKDILGNKSQPITSDSYHQHIGLAISRNLVRTNDGDFQIFSQPGKGTTVEIVLPINV